VRTYSHAIFAAAIASAVANRFEGAGGRAVLPAALGSLLPDLPAGAGLAWAALRRLGVGRETLRDEVCSRRRFALPDAALHSALPVAAALAAFGALRGRIAPGLRGPALGFLGGWAGHVVADALTHGGDARPPFWPLARWRFRSPVSYWEGDRHARAFGLVEHGALVISGAFLLARRVGRR